MTFSEFNLIQSLVLNKIFEGEDPDEAFEEVKTQIFILQRLEEKGKI